MYADPSRLLVFCFPLRFIVVRLIRESGVGSPFLHPLWLSGIWRWVEPRAHKVLVALVLLQVPLGELVHGTDWFGHLLSTVHF